MLNKIIHTPCNKNAETKRHVPPVCPDKVSFVNGKIHKIERCTNVSCYPRSATHIHSHAVDIVCAHPELKRSYTFAFGNQ